MHRSLSGANGAFLPVCGNKAPQPRSGDPRSRLVLLRCPNWSGPGSGAGAPLAVGPHLGPVAADGHVAPGPRAVLRVVVEGGLAVVRQAGLEASPGAVHHRLV